MALKREVVIDIPIYKMQFYVWLCSNKQAQKWYQKTWYDEEDHETVFRSQGGKTISAPGINPIVWVDSTMDRKDIIAGLAHELFHAILFQLTDKGSYIDNPNNSEHYAYLLEYCMKEVLNKTKL